MTLLTNQVFCTTAPRTDYSDTEGVPAPELWAGRAKTNAEVALRTLLQDAKLDEDHFGIPSWNPLGDLIPESSRILIKPNWVHHRNHSGAGLDCLVTHPSVIMALLTYVSKTHPRSVVIGDAPIQGCEFGKLTRAFELNEHNYGFEAGMTLSVRDFRCTTLPGGQLWDCPVGTGRGPGEYVVFDMGELSELEALSRDSQRFRVTMYDPSAMQRTHRPGKHEYLIAREAIDADIVINVPKLKTHKKACITGAMKNVVGLNGHKSYLPHHRKGGLERGGDCYPGGSRLKLVSEYLLDIANRSQHSRTRRLLSYGARLAVITSTLFGDNSETEGSWYGNDTIWRTCLDLQRILHFGRSDGTLDERPQRRVITVTDAIVAGEGEGPLAPSPVPLGMLTLGSNCAAVDWVHAILMGLDPQRIPLLRQAFSPHRFPLARFSPSDIDLEVDGEQVDLHELSDSHGRLFLPPAGWVGHCELTPCGAIHVK